MADLASMIARSNAWFNALSDSKKAEHRAAQRRSFVKGMCPSNRDYAEWCRMVDEMLPEPKGSQNVTDNPHGSLGAYRVRESFNPSGASTVDLIKRHTADLIDMCEEMKNKDVSLMGTQEKARLCALAQTAYEEAAMWAVKAATLEK